MRLPWDEIWFSLTEDISQRSSDPKTKVGAVIVTLDNESVLSLGYNGDEKGGSNKRESMESGMSTFIHAEVNAVTKMNYVDPRERKMYLTHSPCSVCARLIVNAKISEVNYKTKFKSDLLGLDILKRNGIMVKEMGENDLYEKKAT